ncbi:MAG: hydantoinase/oxoprolinase N-terminal domain-containing protein, partial [Alphaproteobacteria bacterium]|nr:hydantoinase/oxoprolinase N-terminal domain-containing protein [Alphaproteobacteria bacterium]
MANDGKGPSDWFTEQLTGLKEDLGQLEDNLRAPSGQGAGERDGRGSTTSAPISPPPSIAPAPTIAPTPSIAPPQIAPPSTPAYRPPPPTPAPQARQEIPREAPAPIATVTKPAPRPRTTSGTGGYRLGVDVGGTFTDLLLIDEGSGHAYTAKVPSTPEDSAQGVLNGINKICLEAGIEPAAIGRVMHGTTVATNTVLTGNGALVGLITTKGYKQVLQIARSYVPGG